MTEHEDIARRLREEAQASAPADLLPAVMAEVRAEPRQARQRRRRPAWPRWQPVAAWTAAAATLVALGFGIAHLPSTSSSSSSSAGSSSTAEGVKAAAPTASHGGAQTLQSQVFTLPKAAAQRILGPLLASGSAAQGLGVRVRVPAARYDYYALRLGQAQRRWTATTNNSVPSPTVIIRLVRAHSR